ncbi:hypothetical protein [Archangium sp.]|uniref:hypothetical protein n=1 Tax=Archangium sp. TaxID=1872627 RepID=UPI002D5076F4|nr:hypothetical protein [Archangium sp.]HYO53694.1 hypothetical protein [Archangium sp.]
MLRYYDDSCTRGDWRRARKVQEDICQEDFASVFVWFIRIATGPHVAYFIESGYLDDRCLSILEKYPDIKGWL